MLMASTRKIRGIFLKSGIYQTHLFTFRVVCIQISGQPYLTLSNKQLTTLWEMRLPWYYIDKIGVVSVLR